METLLELLFGTINILWYILFLGIIISCIAIPIKWIYDKSTDTIADTVIKVQKYKEKKKTKPTFRQRFINLCADVVDEVERRKSNK